MTVLQALDRYYGRMAARGEAEAPGWSREKISFAIVLGLDGSPLDRIDLREASGKKLAPRLLEVPAAVDRSSNIASNLLWDKTAYVLGRTAGDGKRTAKEHSAFRTRHLAALGGTDDPGLVALCKFLRAWMPDQFDAAPFLPEMLDSNLVFCLSGDRGFLHERQAARDLVTAQLGGDGPRGFCLISGREAPIRLLHPVIKGVGGDAQTSGTRLVSFNLRASESYGHEQGANAPTSEAAAFRYGAALNRMLDWGSANRLPRPVGGTTIVFWADASSAGEAVARQAEDWFAAVFNPPLQADDPERDTADTTRLRGSLTVVQAGRAVADTAPEIGAGVRFHVLGLAPNAARLSVRFWLEDSFATFAARLAAHAADLAIEPPPWRATSPSVPRLLVKTTAAQEKFENIPPQLAGEVMRAILAGSPYPRTLLAAAVMRLRAGDDASSGWHAAVIRAVLAREQRLMHQKEGPPVSLDRENPSSAYQLGRMFAVMELAQRGALGRSVNATIRDRYFGAASATPASVFPLLLRGAQNHLAKLRKEKPGLAVLLEKEIDGIAEQLSPEMPRSLRLEDQGRFAIGYYHQRRAKLGDRPADEVIEETAMEADAHAE